MLQENSRVDKDHYTALLGDSAVWGKHSWRLCTGALLNIVSCEANNAGHQFML